MRIPVQLQTNSSSRTIAVRDQPCRIRKSVKSMADNRAGKVRVRFFWTAFSPVGRTLLSCLLRRISRLLWRGLQSLSDFEPFKKAGKVSLYPLFIDFERKSPEKVTC